MWSSCVYCSCMYCTVSRVGYLELWSEDVPGGWPATARMRGGQLRAGSGCRGSMVDWRLAASLAGLASRQVHQPHVWALNFAVEWVGIKHKNKRTIIADLNEVYFLTWRIMRLEGTCLIIQWYGNDLSNVCIVEGSATRGTTALVYWQLHSSLNTGIVQGYWSTPYWSDCRTGV